MLFIVIVLSVLTGAGLCLQTDAFSGLSWLWLLPLGAVGSFLSLVILIFLIFWLCCALVKMDKPQEEDSPVFRFFVQEIIQAIVTVGRIRIHATGLEKAPKSGRFLLVSNHTHDTDPIVLMHSFRKTPLAFISKRENDQKFLVGQAQRKLLCQPINRENDKEALKTILKCIQLIKDDKVSMGVFPEGYIKPDRKLHHFRHGVFKIAQKANVPIVVCTLTNTKYIFANLAKLKPTDVHLHLLEVISAEEVANRTTVELGEHIYNVMAKDLGPEWVADELYEETP